MLDPSSILTNAQIIEAIKQGDQVFVDNLIANNEDLSLGRIIVSDNNIDLTALDIALNEATKKIVKLSSPQNINSALDVCKSLLLSNAKCRISNLTNLITTLLMHQIRLDFIELLKNSGENGFSYIHDAVATDNMHALDLFINQDGNHFNFINEKNANGDKPLDIAIQNLNLEMVKRLIDLGAIFDDELFEKALNTSFVAENFDLLKKFLELRRDENSINIALRGACKFNKLEFLDCLIEMGGDINSKSKTGLMPIHFASIEGNVLIVEKLIKKGADIDSLSNKGLTPLKYAVANGLFDVVKLLIDNNASVDIKHEFNQNVFFFVNDYYKGLSQYNQIENGYENYLKILKLLLTSCSKKKDILSSEYNIWVFDEGETKQIPIKDFYKETNKFFFKNLTRDQDSVSPIVKKPKNSHQFTEISNQR